MIYYERNKKALAKELADLKQPEKPAIERPQLHLTVNTEAGKPQSLLEIQAKAALNGSATTQPIPLPKPSPILPIQPVSNLTPRAREEYALFTALLGPSAEAKRLRAELDGTNYFNNKGVGKLVEYVKEFEQKYKMPPSFVALHNFIATTDQGVYNSRWKTELTEIEQSAPDASLQEIALRKALDSHAVKQIMAGIYDQAFQKGLAEGDVAVIDMLRNLLKQEPHKRFAQTLDAVDRQTTEEWTKVRNNPPNHRLIFGLFEPGQVTQLAGMSTVANKTTFMLWNALCWAADALPHHDATALEEAYFDKFMRNVGYKLHAPDRGWVLYLCPDATQGDAANKICRLTRKSGSGELPKEDKHGNPLVPADLGQVPRFRFLGSDEKCLTLFEPLALNNEYGWQNVVELVERERLKAFPDGKPADGLIVIDTLASMEGEDNDENDNSSRTSLAKHAEWIARRTGCAVVVIHHVSQESHKIPAFANINPLTYGRGGTGLAARFRANAILAPLENTDGMIIGMKIIGNNMPGLRSIFWQVHNPGEQGVFFWRPITNEAAYEIQKALLKEKAELAQAEEDESIDCGMLLELIKADRDGNTFSQVDAAKALVKVWTNEDGTPRTDGSPATHKKVKRLLKELVEQGEVVFEEGKKKPYSIVQRRLPVSSSP